MVSIFIEGKKLDLFKDENIQLISKSSDIESLDKVFTDFSQPFTVPATPTNNTIFKHYYDFNIDNGLNINVRSEAYIEFDSIPFKYGTIQLESVSMKLGKPTSYKLTFYGGLKQLTDVFGDDPISALDYDLDGLKTHTTLSQYDFDWGDYNWFRTLYNDTYNDGDLITPMILMADRDINIGGGGDRDITIDGSALRSDETRTALRVIKLIEGIQTKYNITFSDHFFKRAHFSNIFLWLNNREEQKYSSTDFVPDDNFTGSDYGPYFAYETPYLTLDRRIYHDDVHYVCQFIWQITPSLSHQLVSYDVEAVDENDTVIQRWDNQIGYNELMLTYLSEPDGGVSTETTKEEVKLRIYPHSRLVMDIHTIVYYRFFLTTLVYKQGTTTNVIMEQSYKVEDNITDMKVIEFLQSIMKMYKLVIKPTSETTFYVDTIDNYFKTGQTHNITEFVNTESSTIDKPIIYSKIDFKFEKTDNVLGSQFRQVNDPFSDKIGYGDLSADFETSEKKELKVELPFENMLFERMPVIEGFNGTFSFSGISNLMLGLSSEIDSETSEISQRKSKPILFYNNGVTDLVDTPIKVVFASGTASGSPVSLYYSHLIGNTNDQYLNQVTNTLNWGAERDGYHNGEIVYDSLYQTYWKNWIESIYDTKQRKLKFKAILPTRLLLDLSIEDKIIIGADRYRINDFKSELTTGKVVFNLYKDIFQTSIPKGQVSPFNIISNVGKKYYGINVDVDDGVQWSVTKVSNGFDTDWVDLINTSGVGSGEATILVNTKLDQVVPTVFDDRSMYIRITINGFNNDVTVTQTGLRDPT